ncbi:hypothetical protein OC25_03890 [Pedobacter kyungheensis]|uniref:Restriction endonuclease n=1 Tax=Pedobacter kyungheensis TaxID=1069985 RepID=A0A0C1FWK0_9SPHI|nr:hypothetical protein [Pedobacter kyungheensis]KIA96228.1 hypothetical protein OC25_03890 [Pedobacter kyungheensis]
MLKRTITVFEHDSLRLGQPEDGRLSVKELECLQLHAGEEGVPYYSLIHKGVKFCGYVGVIALGHLNIEVLPKIDRGSKQQWRKVLVDMLRKVGVLDVISTNDANLKLKKNNILDLYIAEFIKEVQVILHQGLLKKYRKQEGNTTSLKGKLLFQKHLTKNIVHQERFFVKYTLYDRDNLLNQLLYKTLKLIKTFNHTGHVHTNVEAIMLDFPDMNDIYVSEDTFEKIVYSRKNEHYRKALMMSRLLLLNYHPDINAGKSRVMALMFDMNQLWEKFVYLSLKKYLVDATIEPQANKPYWRLFGKRPVNLRPDVVIKSGEKTFVLDTKWKLPYGNKPGYADLQQMYAYTKYFSSDHTILCYPGADEGFVDGHFHHEESGHGYYRCSVLRLKFDISMYPSQQLALWQKDIAKTIGTYCKV